MAFVTHPLPTTSTSRAVSRSQCKRRVVRAIASESKPLRTVKAPVVASRVAGVTESHHWIHVNGGLAKAFERAAAANASVTALVEERAGAGARRRWVLRRCADPSLDFVDGAFTDDDLATFVVMEQWDDNDTEAPESTHTHRWLSAVRRVGPMLGAIDIQTLSYRNIFRARKVNSPPNPDGCIIVTESINVHPDSVGCMSEILSTTAQASVAAGECLEFSILQSTAGNFFKTVEVYADAQAIRNHMDGVDRSFVNRTRGKTMGEHRERQTFKASLLA